MTSDQFKRAASVLFDSFHQSLDHLCLLLLIRMWGSVLLLISLLNADEEEVLVGSDKNLLLLGADAEESHVVHWVDVTHH